MNKKCNVRVNWMTSFTLKIKTKILNETNFLYMADLSFSLARCF